MEWDTKTIWFHLYLDGIQQQRLVEGVIVVFFVLNFPHLRIPRSNQMYRDELARTVTL